MARPGISKLGLPPKQYRADRRTTRKDGLIRFETEDAARAEDRSRLEWLPRAAREHPDIIDAERVKRLLKRLKWAAKYDERGNTPASSVYMRDMRLRIVGWLWALQDDADNAPVTTAHVLPTSWIIPAEDLMLANPNDLLECFRAGLNRCGAGKADGFLFAALHGEYNASDGCFHLHLHCVVAQVMIDVVENFREIEKARLQKTANSDNRRPPVRIDARPLYNLPDPISYSCKSYWQMKGHSDSASGKLIRGKGRRVPEPWHSLYLLWLDRWTIEELTLVMKLSVRAESLHVSR